MKNFFKKLHRKTNKALIGAKCALESRKAEGYVDTGVKILIAVVLGALVLALLYALLNGTVRLEKQRFLIPKAVTKQHRISISQPLIRHMRRRLPPGL